MKHIYVCSDCNSANVSTDATAKWDMEAQDWVLTDVCDGEYCEDCEGETRLDYITLEEYEKSLMTPAELEKELCDELGAWYKDRPQYAELSADEALLEYSEQLTREDKNYLSDFCDRWDAMREATKDAE